MPTKILLIDDDQGITGLLSRALSRSGFEVMATNNSSEGVRWARTYCPDIVITDLMMPEMNGWEVCKKIRTFSYVPIIVSSARNEPHVIASVLDAGADRYLVKPYSVGTLVAYIKSIACHMLHIESVKPLSGIHLTPP
jgi:two-component system KDP operon response regulator KdpE